ncbi:MAG: G8 domain-containing protein [Armatimonadota bacterium]
MRFIGLPGGIFLLLVVYLLLAGGMCATATTVTWKPNLQGDWSDPTKWTGGVVPQAGDEVTVGAGATINLSRSTPLLGALTLGGTLVFTRGDAELQAKRITLRRGGIVTHTGPFTERTQENRVTIVCPGTLTLEAGSRITVDEKGYAGGVGHALNDDPASAGYGPGAGGYPKVWGASSGGSYGGRGGTPIAVAPYGSAEKPVDPGSGGGGGNGIGGGAGGGAVRITAGVIVFNGGAITANGGDGVKTSYGGGGSGGSVFITCNTFSGTRGTITANGGHGSLYAGGGSGGRIAVVYRVVGKRGVVLSATGGQNGIGMFGTSNHKNFGEPGTLCFPKAKAPGVVIPHTGRVIAPGATDKAEQRDTVFYWMPWKVNSPMITVTKELYRQHPSSSAAAVAARSYVGPRLEMVETQGIEARDDVHTERTMRLSLDNGRTWSTPTPLPDHTRKVKDIEVWEGEGPHLYDEQTGVLVDVWLRQIQVGNIWSNGICNDYTYYRLSRDLGRTWSAPKQLRYEDGAEFDPEHPLKPEFLLRNQAYFGSNILRHSNGTLIHCVAATNTPDDPQNDTRCWKLGSLCFIGRWDKKAQDYRWTAGKRVSISPEISARGLMEPEVAELQDGRVLVVWRGTDTPTTSGRKWFSVSRDGGMTLSPIQEWKYDDGSSFYSPSSYHRMIRHSVTKKLYWIGNITPNPPGGNSPRYPLVIAEVDEKIPALKKNTVTIIDDRDENKHGFGVQFSNFSLLENRETHHLELFLTTYGQEANQDNWMTADCYHYTLAVK